MFFCKSVKITKKFLLFVLKFAFLWCIIIIVYMVRKIHGKPKTDGVRFLRFPMEN